MSYPAEFVNYCQSIDQRLTSLRKSILFILWSARIPLKAYEILDRLLQTKFNAKPPTVYRVLDYFVDSGLVHKIESIQSYTLCQGLEKHLSSELLLVCNHCHQVSEFYESSLHPLLQKLADMNHFLLGNAAIELRGICSSCNGVC